MFALRSAANKTTRVAPLARSFAVKGNARSSMCSYTGISLYSDTS